MGELRASLLRCRRCGGVLPTALESVAVAVHLQDMDVVGEPVQQRAGEAFRSEHLGPLVERQVGGDQDGAPLVALAEDLRYTRMEWLRRDHDRYSRPVRGKSGLDSQVGLPIPASTMMTRRSQERIGGS